MLLLCNRGKPWKHKQGKKRQMWRDSGKPSWGTLGALFETKAKQTW